MFHQSRSSSEALDQLFGGSLQYLPSKPAPPSAEASGGHMPFSFLSWSDMAEHVLSWLHPPCVVK
jgi:hypothetical protein